MEITTVGELLHWSYANLAMAHSAITAKAEKYGRTQFMVRARLYAGLNKRTMDIGPLADDERLKMVLPQACSYCGSREFLSVDHLIPTKRGGANSGDNFVWACRSCNSSKCARVGNSEGLSSSRPTAAMGHRNRLTFVAANRHLASTRRSYTWTGSTFRSHRRDRPASYRPSDRWSRRCEGRGLSRCGAGGRWRGRSRGLVHRGRRLRSSPAPR